MKEKEMDVQSFNFFKPVNKIDHITLKDGRQYQVVAYSDDIRRFLYYCSDKTSALTKLLNLTNENVVARLLFYMDFDRIFRHPFEEAQKEALKKEDEMLKLKDVVTLYSLPPSSMIIPITTSIIFESLETNLTKCIERAEKLAQAHLEALSLAYKLFKDFAESAFEYYAIILAEHVLRDPDYVRRIKRGGLRGEELKNLTTKVIEKVTPKLQEKLKKEAKFISKRYEEMPSTLFARVAEYYQRARLWKIYAKSFNEVRNTCFLGENFDPKHFQDLIKQLKKIEVVEDIRLEGICLNPEEDCNNMIVKYGVSDVSFKCEECGCDTLSWLAILPLEKNIYHALKLHYLPEMILAAILSKANWVSELYIREKIRQERPEETKNFDVDIIIKTEDDKLVLVETSVQHSLDNAVPVAVEKKNKFSELNFDFFFYIAPLNIPEYFPIGPKSYILGLKHLSDPVHFINAIIEKEKKSSNS